MLDFCTVSLLGLVWIKKIPITTFYKIKMIHVKFVRSKYTLNSKTNTIMSITKVCHVRMLVSINN